MALNQNHLMSLIKGLREGFKHFGDSVTCIVNSILLTIVYFLGIGPTAIFMKIKGRKLLNDSMRQDADEKNNSAAKSKDTYYEELNLKNEKMEGHYRQF